MRLYIIVVQVFTFKIVKKMESQQCSLYQARNIYSSLCITGIWAEENDLIEDEQSVFYHFYHRHQTASQQVNLCGFCGL